VTVGVVCTITALLGAVRVIAGEAMCVQLGAMWVTAGSYLRG
jgi:hypothetical protein